MTYERGRLEIKPPTMFRAQARSLIARCLEMDLLNKYHEYRLHSESLALPGFPPDRVRPLLERRRVTDETTLIREFRESVRQPG